VFDLPGRLCHADAGTAWQTFSIDRSVLTTLERLKEELLHALAAFMHDVSIGEPVRARVAFSGLVVWQKAGKVIDVRGLSFVSLSDTGLREASCGSTLYKDL